MTTQQVPMTQAQRDADAQKAAVAIISNAQKYAVATQGDYDAGGKALDLIEEYRKIHVYPLDPDIASAHQLHKSLVAKKKEKDGPAAQAEAIIKTKRAAWWADQQRKAREEQERLEREERKKREDEALARAAEAEKAGDRKLAQEIIEEPIAVAPVNVPTPPKDPKSSYRNTYSAKVIDLAALVQAVASGKVSTKAIEPNLVFLNEQARSLKEEFKVSFPGCDVETKLVEARRS